MKRILLGLAALLMLLGCRPALLTQTAAPGGPSPTLQESTPSHPPDTPAAGSTRTPSPTATPSPTPLPVATHDLNLLLLGTDKRVGKDEAGWRTDTIILVAVRPRAGIIAMLSIPRDLWVTIPGYGQDRINVADYVGETTLGPGSGPKLLADTLEHNLGITVDGHVRIDFEGLERIIDALGGITVTSDRALDEWFWDETAPDGVSHMVVVEGPQHMDGHLALQYMRARHGTSDFDRSRRQQQVLLAMREAALRPEVLPRIPALLGALFDTVETDLRLEQMLSLIGLGLRLQPRDYREQVFDASMVRDWTTPAGAQVLLPQRQRIVEVWQQLTSPQP